MRPIVLALALWCGCGPTAQETAQRTLTASARAVAVVDVNTAQGYAAAAAVAIDSVATMAEYHDRMEAWNAIEQGLRIARAALYASQAGLDAWIAGESDGEFLAAVPCLTVSLAALVGLLMEVGIDVPEPLMKAIQMTEAIAGSQCNV